MKTVRTDACNHALGAPPGHEESTGTLQCRVEDDPEYGVVYRSYWHATPEEIAELARGGYVELAVFGGHPPVAVAVACAEDPRSRVIPRDAESAGEGEWSISRKSAEDVSIARVTSDNPEQAFRQAKLPDGDYIVSRGRHRYVMRQVTNVAVEPQGA